jgi:pimeloyl-ACP methyl ester carboxylesterase
MPKRVVIYIPGLGDKRRSLLWVQQVLLRTWRVYGFSSYVFSVDWANRQSFEDRFNDLLELIDKLHHDGASVSLIGASAGASTAILGLIERPDKVTGVVTICGQIYAANALRGPAAAANPRFKQSLARMDAGIELLTPKDRHHILTLRPRADAIVPPNEATVFGATNYRMPVSGHLVGIGFGIWFESYRIVRFLKQISV